MDFLKFFTNNIVLKKLEIRMASWKKMFEFYRNILKKTLIDCTYFFFSSLFFFFFSESILMRFNATVSGFVRAKTFFIASPCASRVKAF